MSSKYSNGPFGIGCAGSCGYATGAVGTPKIQAPIAHLPQSFQTINAQKQFHPIQNINLWNWNSIVSGKTYTYLEAYTQMMIYLGIPVDRITDIQNAIQSLWAGPSDVVNQYSVFFNANRTSQLQGFWIPVNNSDGSPMIPRTDDGGFWYWTIGLVRSAIPSVPTVQYQLL